MNLSPGPLILVVLQPHDLVQRFEMRSDDHGHKPLKFMITSGAPPMSFVYG